MTLKELSQLYYLNREIERDKCRLAELKAKAYAASHPNLLGTGGSGAPGDRVGFYASEIAEIENIISEKLRRCFAERIRLERYIADIPDSLTRQIFTLRFVGGLSWVQVAQHIGGITIDSAKKICYRYLDNTNEK